MLIGMAKGRDEEKVAEEVLEAFNAEGVIKNPNQPDAGEGINDPANDTEAQPPG
jgi:hypothetical protein